MQVVSAALQEKVKETKTAFIFKQFNIKQLKL